MEPVVCDVITIAAINLNENAKYDPVQNLTDYRNITKDKIRLMVSLAAQNKVKNLIVGSWGCGVFNNDPTTMSQYFSEVLIGEGYSVDFDNIVFAIINDHNSVGNNFDIFNNHFNG